MTKRRGQRKPDAWMPLFIGDYLRDTASLTTEQHGAYLLLLMAMWPQGGRIPLDDEELAAITRLGLPRWKAQRARLLRFFQVSDGWLIHARLAEEFAHAMSVYRKRVESGKKGGRPAEPDLFEETERLSERDTERDPKSPPQSQPQPPSSSNNTANGEIPPALDEGARARLHRLCKELAGLGVECSTGDPSLVALVGEGFTVDAVLDLARSKKGKGKPPLYLLRTLRGQRKDAEPAADESPPTPAEDPRLQALRDELAQQEGAIYDARHLCDTLKQITKEERDERIRTARERISEVTSAMTAIENGV